MTAPDSDPIVGRTIGQYQVLARVGGGGMGVVYTARDSKLGRMVALKFLPSQWSHDDAAKQRFLREAQAASATNHPNICTIHDLETADDGQLFIVMAYYEGETLKQRLEPGALPIDDALNIATQVADGLAKAHSHGIVHRDIKPSNLIVTEDGVRILDFGLATFVDALQITAENTPLGTLAYMSPEQVRGLPADARSDVWAAGAVLYEMLTGHRPFRGSHAEAIGFAIRNEPPASIRAERREIPEEVEQLVFRALHKEPSVRYRSGRELARALRQVRGLTVPMDLRTEPIPASVPHRTESWKRRLVGLVAAALVVLVIGGVLGVAFLPVDRALVAIMPAVNVTGYNELDPLRLALSQQVSAALIDSSTVRVVGHEQLLSVLRRFRVQGKDLSSGEALQAVRDHTGADVLVVISIVNDGSGFRARIDFRDSKSLSTETRETPAEASTLVKQAAYALMTPTVDAIEQFGASRSRRARFAHLLRSLLRRPPSPTFATRSLEGSSSLEQGLDAYEQLEYVRAREFFAAAAAQEPLSPLPPAWQSRVARVTRRASDAEQFARRAIGLLSNETPAPDRLFVEAVMAESQGNSRAALEKYQARNSRHPDDPDPLLELAAFQDRDSKDDEAIVTYRQALAVDTHVVRPELELCRLYNRVNEPINARAHGRRAVERYEALGSDGDRAQALLCLSDSLRQGEAGDRQQAVQYADAALGLLQSLRYAYGVSRAHNYVALALESSGRLDDAVGRWKQSLVAAQDAGNAVLEPLVRMNLGATLANLGQRTTAIRYLRDSATGFEGLGDRSRAAESQFNIGAMLLQYGGDAEEGRRLVQDALEVFRQLKNRNFEVLSTHVMSTYFRYAGRFADAERELNKALNLARERDLDWRSATTSLRIGQLRFDSGDYEAARRVLEEPHPNATVPNQIETQLTLARTYVRLGDFTKADALLTNAVRALGTSNDASIRLLLATARGELAYEARRVDDAHRYFSEAAAYLTDQFPDLDALTARTYVGLIEAGRGDAARGRAIIGDVLEIARRSGYFSLQARCRVFLAQIAVAQRQFHEGAQTLDDIPGDDDARSLDPELRAEVEIWRGRVRAAGGDPRRGAEEQDAGRRRLRGLADRLDDAHRRLFLSRPRIAEILS